MDIPNKKPGINDLSRWFSPARMSRYAQADDPAALYAWVVRLQKAFLEDVEHVEVLLRNFIAERLASDCLRRTAAEDPGMADRHWYDHASMYNLNDRFEDSVRRAKRRLSHEGTPTDYDHVVAALSLDVWWFLLVRRLEPTVWRALCDKRNGGMPHYPGANREEFESHVATIYHLRDHCSHQEHLVLADAGEERRQLGQYAGGLHWAAKRIDPEAEDWIKPVSRVDELPAARPTTPED